MFNFFKNLWKNLFVMNDEIEGVDPMDTTDKIRKFARAQGRVQGVGFRYFVQTLAKKEKVTGWVKNEYDGSVTMEIQGTPEQLDALESQIKKGNGFARVSQFDTENISVVSGESQFSIHY